MKQLQIKEIIDACRGKIISGNVNSYALGIATDSRTIKKGEIFLAVQGPVFNGHDFVAGALKKGAIGAIVSNIDGSYRNMKNKVIIRVSSTTEALMDIANYYRKKFNCKVIGITGSNGKTTTKEMAAFLLSKKFNVLKAEGSFNNQIGVPLTLFKLNSRHDIVVVELGMNHAGEIKKLAKVIEPNIGVITNVGIAHTEFLKNIKNVAKAKGELLEVLAKNNGTAVLNWDDAEIRKLGNKYKGRIVTFGIKKHADVKADHIKNINNRGYSFNLCIGKDCVKAKLNMLGFHNIYNVLCASAVAYSSGMTIDLIKKAVNNFKQEVKGRLRVFNNKKNIIIDDTYNANPASVKTAIDTLDKIKCCGKKIIVLGDMLELGKLACSEHRQIGKCINGTSINVLFTLGNYSRNIASQLNGKKQKTHFSYKDELINELKKILEPGDVVLVKGSRRMKMEEIVKALLERKQ